VTKKLTWNTTLDPIYYPPEIKEKYFQLSIKYRKKFVDWIGKISLDFRKDYIWWIKLPSSRDPYKSDLFKNMLILLVLKDKKILKQIGHIVFENKLIYNSAIKDNKINLKKLEIKIKKKNYLFKLFNSILFSIFNFLIIKITTKKNQFSNKNYVLINTILETKDKIHDYVFPGLHKMLKAKRKNHVLFVPNFLVHKNLINHYKNIKILLKQNFFFIENLISFSEFKNCILKLLFSKKLEIKKKKFKKFFLIDCSLLINHEYNSKKDFYAEFQSIIKIIFIKKLSKHNLKISKTICRFENQAIDRSWFYGFRKYFPSIKNFGYQGFLYYPQLLNQSPTFYEEKAKVLPNEILVPGKQALKHRKEFYKEIKLKIAPSFNKYFHNKKKKAKKIYKFTLALCGIYSLDESLISWIIFVLSKNSNIKVIIKPHPMLSIQKFQNLISRKLSHQIIISKEPADILLQKSEFLISSGPTSIVFESLLHGCKLLYLNLDPSDIFILKKKLIKKENFKFIKKKYSLLKIMTKYNNLPIRKSNYYKQSFFYSKLTNNNLKFFY
tara:strand:+ start:1460 stop:3115 length:1656 start_codon:yes stop_codon:yes gene_type:complete